MTLTVYFDYLSQPARSVVTFLKVLGVEFEAKEVSVPNGDTHTAEYRKMNPMGAVPVIDDNGFILTECNAILRYLKAKHNAADHWYPADLGQRARVDEYLSWHHVGLRKVLGSYFFASVLMPFLTKQAPDMEKVEEAKPGVEKALDLVENFFLKDRDFLATNDVTLADIRGITEIMQVSATGYDVTTGRPRLAAWMSRVQQKLNPHFDVTHKKIVDLGKLSPK